MGRKVDRAAGCAALSLCMTCVALALAVAWLCGWLAGCAA